MYRRDQRPYSLVFRVAKTLQAAGAEAALATEEEANQKLKEGWNRIIRPSIKEIERYRYYTILCYMYNDIHLDIYYCRYMPAMCWHYNVAFNACILEEYI